MNREIIRAQSVKSVTISGDLFLATTKTIPSCMMKKKKLVVQSYCFGCDLEEALSDDHLFKKKLFFFNSYRFRLHFNLT